MELKQNPAQEEAISTIRGHVIIVSCPGSGKTTTLIRRIHHMLEEGAEPSSILMVTFTKSAAMNMQEKYIELYGSQPGIIFKTIHSLCYSILIREKVITRDSVLPEEKQREFLVERFRSARYGDAYDMAENALTAITDVKNNGLDPETYKPAGIKAEIFQAVFRDYEEWKRKQDKIDYDDMLILTNEILKDSEETLRKYSRMFSFVQCDEYQDTNTIQRDILYALSTDSGNLCVVGDDDQSIYAFRGARPSIMLHFKEDFPDAKVIFMGTNYRSGFSIVYFSDKVIRHNKERFPKEFISERGREGFHGDVTIKRFTTKGEQRDFIIREVQRLHLDYGIPYREMAVLMRTNEQAQLPVNAFSQLEIPYYSTEVVKTIYESFIFSDIRAYVNLSAGIGNEEDMIQVLNHPTRYFQEAKFRGAAYTERSLKNHAYQMNEAGESWKFRKACESIEEWMAAFGPGVITYDSSPSTVMEHMDGGWNSIRYDEYLHAYADYRNMDYEDIREQFDLLIEDASLYHTVREWFEAAERNVRKMKDLSWQKDTEGVRISTMHKAKGMEWKAVFLIDADEFVMPHKKAIRSKEASKLEEERRLFYVGMTRAKDHLFILGSGPVSRFVKEIRES